MQALARALFARYNILLLDDSFSELDGETEKTIFENLLGATGLTQRLRTTVVLISNSCILVLAQSWILLTYFMIA